MAEVPSTEWISRLKIALIVIPVASVDVLDFTISQLIAKKSFRLGAGVKNFPTMIPVVAIALIDASGRVLLQRRRADRAHGGLWEFPGGKVEPAETAESALIREVEEELGIAVASEHLAPLTFASVPDQQHVVLLYTCRCWTGEPVNHDAELLAWVKPKEFGNYAMPPLDVPLAKALHDCIEKGI